MKQRYEMSLNVGVEELYTNAAQCSSIKFFREYVKHLVY